VLADAQVEGPGLAFLVNPVMLDGEVLWASFFGPAWAVHRAVHPSRDAFEHEAQHRPEWLEVLWALHVDRDVLAEQPAQKALVQYAARAGWPAFEAMQRLLDMAWRRDRYAEALHARGKAAVDSAAEALEIMRALEPCRAPPQRLAEMLEPVLALARRRFEGAPGS
jgi:hypothetical protein